VRATSALVLSVSVCAFAACFSEGGKESFPEADVGGMAGALSNAGASGSATSEGGQAGNAGGGGLPTGTAGAGGDDGASGEGAGATGAVQATCNDALGEPLPARRAITSNDARPPSSGETVITITKTKLFNDFVNLTCGSSGCHGGADDPLAQAPESFRMTIDSFDQRPDLGTISLARILSADPLAVMPPGSGDGSKRKPNDPVRVLGERLFAWQEAGFPESFDIVVSPDPGGEELPDDPYLLSPELGNKLTNIGSCVPKRSAMLSMVDDEMNDKDALFESLETSDDLPDTLFETDLVSLDSAVLARRRVLSYAPTYPLFSDHAGKMRHVRVPAGETIHYDPETRDFDIPDNTRFYKTFLKDVRDKDGKVGWRKMETRLIVVRRDEALPDGTYRPRALRATYAWDKEERMARRVTDPLRDGSPAADRLCPVIVDETVVRDPLKNPISDQISEFCGYMTQDEMEDPSSGKVRHYAIPSTERCDQCHMGSHNRSYILGFDPFQVDRRADGEGGVYEAPTADELTQLQRFIDYGVITGIEPGQIKLEESQGKRRPRNHYELKAQAYMIGNCAFCHNPNGFPVVQNPVLAEFDLYPSEQTGGIFEFSLERYSPRAKAAQGQSVRFPYITPIFGDHKLQGQDLAGNEGLNALTGETQFSKEYVISTEEGPTTDWDERPRPPEFLEYVKFENNVTVQSHVFQFPGPWRSLIWRNVYTPFTYVEDSTIFIHMPRNVAGYDCRAHTIMADWMLSIPSVLKPDEPYSHEQPALERPDRNLNPSDYRKAIQEAEERVAAYRLGVTGSHCPSDEDIVDPGVILSPLDPSTQRKVQASPIDRFSFESPRIKDNIEEILGFGVSDQVPELPHWTPTDTTDASNRFRPRRQNWKQIIATREVPVSEKLGRVIDDLQTVHLTPADEAFSLQQLPLGLWHSDCRDSSQVSAAPTVAEMAGEPPSPNTRWLDGTVFEGDSDSPPPLEARVHLQSRGETVFRAICQNCHGKSADSKSPLAATIVELTGGQTRVANFVAGLFGPPEAPGSFARGEFLIDHGASPEDWAVRYLLFMGLGGTEAAIPQAVLKLVATSPFYGKGVTAGVSDPNMLDSAQQVCFYVLGHDRVLELGTNPPSSPQLRFSRKFAPSTGHYEVWESICTSRNEPVVRVFSQIAEGQPLTSGQDGVFRAKDVQGNWVYPSDALVGNQRGEIERGITASNTMPWCIREDALAPAREWALAAGIPEASIPVCPPTLLARSFDAYVHRLALTGLVSGIAAPDPSVPFSNADFTERWVRRGAMNAGIAAYYYLRGMTSGALEPSLPFDFCKE
jgi:mono/diheme cytochrome c family protein